jgi:hypothetical protein
MSGRSYERIKKEDDTDARETPTCGYARVRLLAGVIDTLYIPDPDLVEGRTLLLHESQKVAGAHAAPRDVPVES